MTKIPDLAALTAADPTDLLVVEDVSAATTKKITRDNFFTGAPLPNNSVTGNALATNAITLGYAQTTTTFNTANQNPTQVTGLTTSVTIPAGGRKVEITVYCPGVAINAVANAYLRIWDGAVGSGTTLQEAVYTSAGGNYYAPMTAMAIVTPAAGSKTYNASFHVSGNTGTINAASTTIPFIVVKLI